MSFKVLFSSHKLDTISLICSISIDMMTFEEL